jgi:tRNA-dihydrouridine synthase A
MVVDATVNHAPAIEKFLYFEPSQHPIALQLGGNNPETLGKAAAVAYTYGYDEINLNCGCPSSRVAVRTRGTRRLFRGT